MLLPEGLGAFVEIERESDPVVEVLSHIFPLTMKVNPRNIFFSSTFGR